MGTLSYLHVIAGDFNAALYAFLKGPTIEGFVKHIYSDGLGIPTLGVGFALADKPQGSRAGKRCQEPFCECMRRVA